MFAKIIFSFIVTLLACKDGFCDPIPALLAIGASLSGAGAALGPAGVLAAGGLGMSAMSMMDTPDKSKVNNPTATNQPDSNAAAKTAEAKQNSDRQAMLLSGGQTTLTGISGSPLLGANLKSNSLLGT